MNYDITISVSNEDKWIAREIFIMLQNYSIRTFFYEESKDLKGKLLKKLETIYSKSFLDIAIVSDSYINSQSEYLKIEKETIINKYKTNKIFPIIIVFNLSDSIKKDDEFIKFIQPFEHLFLKKEGFRKIVEYILALMMNNHYILRNNFCPLYHPYGVNNRITVDFVNFKINKNFKKDYLKKFNKLGDILVDVDYPLRKYCYLIPSGRVPPFLSNSIFLKTNEKALKLKKILAEDFIKLYSDERLIGILIFITNNDNYLPYVYCDSFDNFIVENYLKYYEKMIKKGL